VVFSDVHNMHTIYEMILAAVITCTCFNVIVTLVPYEEIYT
jgi:hypothetical protein